MAKKITINADGTYTPVTITNGEDVTLDVSDYKAGTDECEIDFKIKFRKKSDSTSQMAFVANATARTIKIGS